MKQSKLSHLMTSLVPGLGKRKLHFFSNFGGEEKLFWAPEQSLNSKIMNPCNIDFNFLELKNGQKFHFTGTLKMAAFSLRLNLAMAINRDFLENEYGDLSFFSVVFN